MGLAAAGASASHHGRGTDLLASEELLLLLPPLLLLLLLLLAALFLTAFPLFFLPLHPELHFSAFLELSRGRSQMGMQPPPISEPGC